MMDGFSAVASAAQLLGQSLEICRAVMRARGRIYSANKDFGRYTRSVQLFELVAARIQRNPELQSDEMQVYLNTALLHITGAQALMPKLSLPNQTSRRKRVQWYFRIARGLPQKKIASHLDHLLQTMIALSAYTTAMETEKLTRVEKMVQQIEQQCVVDRQIVEVSHSTHTKSPAQSLTFDSMTMTMTSSSLPLVTDSNPDGLVFKDLKIRGTTRATLGNIASTPSGLDNPQQPSGLQSHLYRDVKIGDGTHSTRTLACWPQVVVGNEGAPGKHAYERVEAVAGRVLFGSAATTDAADGWLARGGPLKSEAKVTLRRQSTVDSTNTSVA